MLQEFWFALILVLWVGYFVLEGFDFGVGMLNPFVSRTEADRVAALRTIGPVWDGNEVWLIVAGGATFAAFPGWYASMFAGFYLAFAALLAGLILRGVCIEYRGKAATASGRRWCDVGLTVGSFLPALLLGVAFADLIRGFEMNSAQDITGGFLALLSPYALLGGLVSLALFLSHGAVFLALRTTGDVRTRAAGLAVPLTLVATLLAVVFVVWTTQVRGGWVSGSVGVVLVFALAAAALPALTFACLWPNLLLARNDHAFSLTVAQASSGPYTLKVMTVVALVMTPVVLAYQAWSYWVFRARVAGTSPTARFTQRPRAAR